MKYTVVARIGGEKETGAEVGRAVVGEIEREPIAEIQCFDEQARVVPAGQGEGLPEGGGAPIQCFGGREVGLCGVEEESRVVPSGDPSSVVPGRRSRKGDASLRPAATRPCDQRWLGSAALANGVRNRQ